ncbi:hypothetical protein BOTBODRAFT_531168 [Botryobasidium botryosum FD-172 SS1]|uniref:N-alpha-acetyltransferase 40 n=1 Tax=Botryobasidium botryosum (strain FD-172 SS1) TaxID=930990 RepID=A0A067MCD1_BOTB1|nr:hypothetical protein BOTBODRAFT_531168 [Botryobasidium botryosum FD-172 SS1]
MVSLVQLACKASSEELQTGLGTSRAFGGKQYAFNILRASELSVPLRQKIWALFEENMHGYTSSTTFEWNPPSKKKELFHRNSRYLCVSSQGVGESEERVLVAFTMFRFDWEDTTEEKVYQEVLYLYELQVSQGYRKLGLGRVLIRDLEAIGIRWQMKKIMLTVLKANQGAILFYDKMGFNLDPISPDFVDPTSTGNNEEEEWVDEDEDCDYKILSKVLR